MRRHILCLGDSNTHGYCADPEECYDSGFEPWRFDEDARWTCLLQKRLGESFLVIEEGLNGRTTVFPDPLMEGVNAMDYLAACLKTHQPLDLLIIMLGTNDCKARFLVNAAEIALGMELLATRAAQLPVWRKKPNLLIVAPAPIGADIDASPLGHHFGAGSVEKSVALANAYEQMAKINGFAFLDAGHCCTVSPADCVHLTRASHASLAQALESKVRELTA